MSKRRYVVATLKGGPGKTTTAFYLALGLARRGHRVVAIDADPRSQGLADWHGQILQTGETPFPVVQWPDGSPLVAYAEQVEREMSADRVVIDTGGERPDVFSQACRFADQLVCPVGPMAGELRRIPATFRAASEVDATWPIEAAALLTRVPAPGAGAAREARAVLDEAGVYVLAAEVARREREYADAWGVLPVSLGEYAAVLDELEPAEGGHDGR